MSTVPGPDTPAPANNAKTLVLSSDPGLYGRPSAGGAATGNNQGAGPGPTPGYSISKMGAPVGTGGTQAGADIGSGTTIIAGQPDATGHPAGDASGGGTVGDSGPQGAGPASNALGSAS